MASVTPPRPQLPTPDVPIADANLALRATQDWYDYLAGLGAGAIGEWTPLVSFANPGSFDPGNVNSRGNYCRIGPLCFYSMFYSVFNQVIGTATGNLRITGLPFTVAGANFYNTMAQPMIFDHGGIVAPGITEFALIPIGSEKYFEIFCTGPGFSLNAVTSANATNVFGLIASGFYFIGI